MQTFKFKHSRLLTLDNYSSSLSRARLSQSMSEPSSLDSTFITCEGLGSSSFLPFAYSRSRSLFQNHSALYCTRCGFSALSLAMVASSLTQVSRSSRTLWLSIFAGQDTMVTDGPMKSTSACAWISAYVLCLLEGAEPIPSAVALKLD